MNPANILVFPCGSEIALEIQRALSRARGLRLCGASASVSNHGRHAFERYAEGVPFVDQPGCADALRAVVRDFGADFIYPAHDDALCLLAGREDLGARVLGSGAETAAICRSKRATYERLEGRVRVPRVYATDEAYPVPVFLKPDASQGSKGTCLARSRAEVAIMLDRDPSLLLLEYLPGREYTVDCFTDRFGALRFAGARERIRTSSGISTHTRVAEAARFQAIAKAANEALSFRGAWFFQVKEDARGELALMEAAPRVSGGMGLYRCRGINLPLLTVYDAMGLDVDIPPQADVPEMDRALQARYTLGFHYSVVYLDFDDTLCHEGHLDPMAVAFLAQCRNRGIPVRLLSRHAGDLAARLESLGLSGWFDAVHHLDAKQDKAEFIREPDALFIDDSFAERERVRAACGVPVFAPDAFEALLDGRA